MTVERGGSPAEVDKVDEDLEISRDCGEESSHRIHVNNRSRRWRRWRYWLLQQTDVNTVSANSCNKAMGLCIWYCGTSLFQPHLGPAKVTGLERWLDQPHYIIPILWWPICTKTHWLLQWEVAEAWISEVPSYHLTQFSVTDSCTIKVYILRRSRLHEKQTSSLGEDAVAERLRRRMIFKTEPMTSSYINWCSVPHSPWSLIWILWERDKGVALKLENLAFFAMAVGWV